MPIEFERRLFGCTDVQSVIDCALDAGLRLTGADLGNVQLLDWKENYLTIVAQRGFHREFLDFFQRVNVDNPWSVSARALRERRAIVISDVMLDEGFAPCRAIAERAGFRSVQSTPIISSSGAPFGIVSTHFPTPHQPTEDEMNSVRSFANLAARAIIRLRPRPETIEQSHPLTDQGFTWQPVPSAPFDRDLELAVIDHHGTHTLAFACRRVLHGWVDAETNELIDGLRPTHWREWQAT